MMSSFYTIPQKHVKKKRSAHPEERSGVQAHIILFAKLYTVLIQLPRPATTGGVLRSAPH
jgi:hypothetical protein